MKRELTSTDKRVICDIISHADAAPANYLLVNAFADIFESVPVTYCYSDKGEESLTYYYDGERWTRNKATEILTSFEANIVDRSDLIQFLIDEKYIVLLKPNRESLPLEFELFAKGRDWEGIAYSDFGKETFMVFRNSFCRVIITERLRRFCKNDFLTDEECLLKEVKKQTELAKKQVEEARNQSESAKEQTNEAKKQRRWALATFLVSLFLSIPTAYTSYKAIIKGEKCACEEILENIKKSIDKIDIQSLIDVEQTVTFNQDSIIKLLQPKQEEPKCDQPKKATATKTTKKATKKQSLYLPLDTINCDGKEYVIVEKVK